MIKHNSEIINKVVLICLYCVLCVGGWLCNMMTKGIKGCFIGLFMVSPPSVLHIAPLRRPQYNNITFSFFLKAYPNLKSLKTHAEIVYIHQNRGKNSNFEISFELSLRIYPKTPKMRKSQNRKFSLRIF